MHIPSCGRVKLHRGDFLEMIWYVGNPRDCILRIEHAGTLVKLKLMGMAGPCPELGEAREWRICDTG